MTNARRNNSVAAALDYLRKHHHFVEFDNQERVFKVGVSDATDVDEIAAHIGSLRDLQELTFYRTGLSDGALSHLANLASLKELSVGGSGFTSAGFLHLAGMSKLEDLYLKDARGLDLVAFAHLARVLSLRKLTFSGGSFSDADLAPLAALVNLERLSLSECNEVHGTFCKHLIGLPRLRRLTLGEFGGQVTDEGLASIAGLSSLTNLHVSGPFTNVGLAHLAVLQNLDSLAVESSHVTAQGIAVVAKLPKLNYLYFDTPDLADDSIPALLRCSMLETLRFRRSSLSDAGLQRLRDSLPKCGVVDFRRDADEFGPCVDKKDTNLPRLENTTPFLTLLAKASDWDLVNGTFHKIGDRYDHWVDASQYSPEESVVMLVWHSSGIIDNGGFEWLFAGQFFGDPDFSITAEAFKTAGLLRGHEAFVEAFALFPGGTVPHDPAERNKLYQAANRSARHRLNRKLWQDGYDGSREKQLAKFIRTNAVRFGDLDGPS